MVNLDLQRLGGRTTSPRTSPSDLGDTFAGAAAVRDDVPPIELGVTRHFGSGDLGRAGLLSGWAQLEDGHNWNDGCEALLDILVSDPGPGCSLEFMGEPFLSERCRRQDVTLYVNGFRVGYWRFTEPRSSVLRVVLEPEQLFRRGRQVLLKCAWWLPDSTSPANLGMSDDSRQLGFCFRSVTVGRV